MDSIVRLDNRAVIEVKGPDAKTFLQGIITNDINMIEGGNALYAGLLTPQGKLLFDFLLVRHKESFLCDIDKTLVSDFLKRLTFYKLRADVQVQELPNASVAAFLRSDTLLQETNKVTFTDPRNEQLGSRILFLEPMDPEANTVDRQNWITHRIGCAIPEGGFDFTYGNCFPHDIAMDQLNGIGFQKGCYVGQEVVSRMQHRGTARKRPMIVKADQDMPVAPQPVLAEGIVVGQLGTSSGNLGLAEIRLDRAAKAVNQGKGFAVDDMQVSLYRPNWADYGEEFDVFSNS